jgi:arylsulfatase A-like enzyme
VLPADSDPDLVLGFSHAYAGQVALLDECLGVLLEAIRRAPWSERALVVFTSLRGMPLGAHGLLGTFDAPLTCELVHVPLLLRLPDGSGALARTPTLVQPPDLAATLRAWYHLPGYCGWGQNLLELVSDPLAEIRDRAVLHDGHAEWAVRTHHWYLRRQSGEGGPRYALYVKPDDRWERNDVADRCPDVVEALDAALSEFLAKAEETDLTLANPLPGPAP